MATLSLRDILRSAGVTQRDLARALGVSTSALSRKLSGARGVRVEEAQKIARFLSAATKRTVRIDDIFPDRAA